MIRVKGIDYRIISYPSAKPHDDYHDHETVELGRVDHLQANIYILDGINTQLQEETVIHEAIHVLTRDDITFDEEKVDTLSQGIYAFLKDNDLIKNGWMEKLIDEREMGKSIDDRDPLRTVDPAAPESLAR